MSFEHVDVRVPAGSLGVLICDRNKKIVVDGFAPVGADGKRGAVEASGKVVKGSFLLGVNEHDFSDGKVTFQQARDILVRTSTAERVVHFGVPKNVLEANPSRHFELEYTLGKELGSGAFSVVYEAVHTATQQKYAVKCIKRQGLSAEDIAALTAEVEILQSMKHPHIMALYDVFTEREYYYLVTELVSGGELFDRIVAKNFYNEREARDLVKILLETIQYCHIHNVVHRDLKPENLLLTSKDDDASIKLADFGFAKRVDGENMHTALGTPGYVAPEILQRKAYGKSVDIWGIGVITYILLSGYPPFHHENQAQLFQLIKAGRFAFDPPYWDAVSQDAKDLICKMLIVDPSARWTAEQLLKHKWIVGADVATVPLTSALNELRSFNARRRFRAAVNTVQATISMTKALTLGSKRSTVIYDDRSVRDDYTLGKELGSGAFSTVYEGVHKKTKMVYAVKAMRLQGLSAADIEGFHSEVEVLKELQHPHIMRLYAVYMEADTYYMITELVAGGELFDRIVEKSYYSEKEARDLVKILLDTLAFCHARKIVHRDLKPENLLLTKKDDDTSIKVADFGFAKRVADDSQGLTTVCGTPAYVAPEILARLPYGVAVDIWSTGVITYILLCGYPPFHDDNNNNAMLFRKIRSGVYQFDSPYWDEVSAPAKDLVSKMLQVNPEKRWTAQELLQHPWIVGEEVNTKPLTSAIGELKKFNARRRLKSAITTVKATLSLAKLLSQSSSTSDVAPPPAPVGVSGSASASVTTTTTTTTTASASATITTTTTTQQG